MPTCSDLLNPQLPIYCIIYPTQLVMQASKLFFCFRADSFLPANRVKFYSIVCTGTVLIRIHLLLIKDGLRYDQDPFFLPTNSWHLRLPISQFPLTHWYCFLSYIHNHVQNPLLKSLFPAPFVVVSRFVAFSWKETIGVCLIFAILREVELAPRHHHSLAICPTGRF